MSTNTYGGKTIEKFGLSMGVKGLTDVFEEAAFGQGGPQAEPGIIGPKIGPTTPGFGQ